MSKIGWYLYGALQMKASARPTAIWVMELEGGSTLWWRETFYKDHPLIDDLQYVTIIYYLSSILQSQSAMQAHFLI